MALEPISLSTLALTTHNIAWSPDAELALGCEDSVYIFLPEFMSSHADSAQARYEDLRQFNDVTLRFPAMEPRRPELNRPLFELAGQEFRAFEGDPTRTSAPITGMGGSLNHVVSLEWSPCGLGRMQRSILAVLTSSGTITVYCEGAPSGAGSFKVRGRNTRTLRSWVAPWAVGGPLFVPLAGGTRAVDREEHITAFAWACDLDAAGGALLAYADDESEVVILSVQARHKAVADPGDPGEWRVEEVARFLADGPHFIVDVWTPTLASAPTTLADMIR